jgi:N-acetylglucosaminyl-diphospho-decaprenol L-rhamnosyltransferase
VGVFVTSFECKQSVTAVLVSYQTGPILFQAVSSALQQTKVSQVIVVDNGNPESVLNILSRRFSADPRFLLLTGHGNIGFSQGCNLGARHATGEILLLLNPDCIVPGNGVNALLRISSGLEGDWMLTPRLVNPDRSEQLSARREILTPWIAFVEGFRLYKLCPNHPYLKRFNHHDNPQPDEVQEIPVASGACLMLSRASYEAIGGMDESFFFHVEDVDFCMRFRKAGGKIFYSPHVSFVHALGSSEVSRTYVEWHKTLGFKRYFKLHFTGVYPPGFVGFVNACITLRFAVIALKELLFSPIRSFSRKRRVSVPVERVAGPVSYSFKGTEDEKIGENSPEYRELPTSHIPNPDSYE